jgi:hypothetical protein
MERNLTSHLTRVLFAAAVCAVIVAAGCSRSPMGESDLDQQPTLLTRTSYSSAGLLTPASLYAESVISSATGGSLALLDVVLTVPAHALANDTLFSIELPDAGQFLADFGTDGLVFDQPVKVTFSYADADLTNVDERFLRIAYYNDATGQFEGLPSTVDRIRKTVSAQVYHFSSYGLVSDRFVADGAL